MNKKLFLTSLTAIAIAIPALAETFPSTGLMQENKTYTEAANHDNMGIYEGTVTANAEYDWNIITVNPGQYIPANSTTAATCTAGYYCEGMTANQQNQTPHYSDTVQGLTACPDGYGTSAPGATANTQCYRACAIANNGTTFTNIAHATAVSGNDYYGAGVDTCEPTACENGWHVKAAVAAPDLTAIIGVTDAGTGWVAIGYGGIVQKPYQVDVNISDYGLTTDDHFAFVVDYGNGKKIRGQGRCTVHAPSDWGTYSNPTMVDSLQNETTEPESYCWCSLDGYTLNNGAMQSLSTPWMFFPDDYYADQCPGSCSSYCARWLQESDESGLEFRTAMFGAVQSSPAMCEGNEITINWGDVDPTYAGQNNEGTAIYGEDIRTPVKAATKPGQTFKGWKFVKPTTPSQGN